MDVLIGERLARARVATERGDGMPEVLDLLKSGVWWVASRAWGAWLDWPGPQTEAGSVHDPVGPSYSTSEINDGPTSKVVGCVVAPTRTNERPFHR